MLRFIVGALIGAGLLVAQGDPKDDKIYNQVRLKLAGDAEVNGGGIEVVVLNGAVTLKGKVLRAKQKQKAEKVARKVKGVTSVTNQLIVEMGK